MEENDMTQQVTNFARFYAVFNLLPATGDREDRKRSIVGQYTRNRTDSLREMTRREYEDCCAALERLTGRDRDLIRAELRRRRSACLHLMQLMGIDTTDWTCVSEFCSQPRIAGKEFRRLDTEELDILAVKLRAIRRKGGLKPKEKENEVKQPGVTLCMTIGPDIPKC